MQFDIQKAACAMKAAVSDEDMALINAQALVELTPEQVFVFRVEMCNDQVDRDHERFALEALKELAPLFVGRTVICDHVWASSKQFARIFRTAVEPRKDGGNGLMAWVYLLRSDELKGTIAAIEGGILREVSVGCAMGKCTCSICGKDAYGFDCQHRRGGEYAGEICVYELSEPIDAYELSFVAVPAQPGAGVTKQSHKQGWTPAEIAAAKARLMIENERWK